MLCAQPVCLISAASLVATVHQHGNPFAKFCVHRGSREQKCENAPVTKVTRSNFKAEVHFVCGEGSPAVHAHCLCYKHRVKDDVNDEVELMSCWEKTSS